jgi:subtilisin family serine protease
LNAGSLRGPTPSPLQNLQKPDITGPGTNIYSAAVTASGYAFLTGTSMSGPHVAGAGLLVAQARPDWTPIEIMTALRTTASQPGRQGLTAAGPGIGMTSAAAVST